MAEKIEVMFSEEEVDRKIRELAAQINKDYEGRPVHVIGVLNGATFFLCELAKRIECPVTLDFMCCSSYGTGTVSSGTVKIIKDLDRSIAGKEVIIAEDIIDSGNTLSQLLPLLKSRNPKSIRICTLLDKPDRREVEMNADYIGFTVPDKFIVGYGLDYDQKYRNLPYIGVVELD